MQNADEQQTQERVSASFGNVEVRLEAPCTVTDFFQGERVITKEQLQKKG